MILLKRVADRPDPGGTDESIGGLLMGVLWSLAGLSTVVLALRLYTAAFIIGRVKVHDYLMVMALVCVIIQTAFITESVRWGLGRHEVYLNDAEVVQAMKAVTLCQGWGIASAMFGRIAFCLYLLQFVGITHRFHATILYFLIGSQALVNSLCIIFIYVQCGLRVEALWDQNISASCWSPIVQKDFGYFQCALNSFADLFLTVLPATLVWSMKMSHLKKLGVSILLGASLFAFVESIVKTYMLKEIGNTTDPTWGLASFSLWAVTESYIVIIGASIPTLAALFRIPKRSTAGHKSEKSKYSRSMNGMKSSGLEASIGWTRTDDESTDLGQFTTSQECLKSSSPGNQREFH